VNCEACGLVVGDALVHADWHRNLADALGLRREVVMATTSGQVDEIVRLTAQEFDIDVAEMLRHERTSPGVEARFVAWFLIRELTELSYPEIGRRFDRHHTTVLNGVQVVCRNEPLGVRAANVAAALELQELLDASFMG
jgi:hypothetical protein